MLTTSVFITVFVKISTALAKVKNEYTTIVPFHS